MILQRTITRPASDNLSVNEFPSAERASAEYAFASVAAAELYDEIAVASLEQINSAVNRLWAKNADGLIGDQDATFLQEIAEQRRGNNRSASVQNRRAIAQLSRAGRFKSRRHPRSPDRQKSRERRRMLAGSGALPPGIRHCYPEGQRAVLTVITLEIRGDGNGTCIFPVDKIAAIAGVCRTTVQSALHEAQFLGHITVEERPQAGRKNLTNVVTVSSPEWKNWIKRGSFSDGTIGSNSAKKSSPTKTRDIKKGNSSNHNGSAFVDRDGQASATITALPSAIGVDVALPTSLRLPGPD
jgi:hypothetical protein